MQDDSSQGGASTVTSAPRTARARARLELTNEIKAAARRHVAEHGASDLSLRAVARELGMASSALYRYFPSRDALLTELIVDAYNALGEAVEAAVRSGDRDDLLERWMRICRAVRGWAIDNPHEYALIYGSPVPGYVAPQTTTDPATRVSLMLLELLADAVRLGRVGPSPPSSDVVPAGLDADFDRLTTLVGETIPDWLLVRGMAAWMQLFGMISFELFGHLATVITDPGEHFDLQCRRTFADLGVC